MNNKRPTRELVEFLHALTLERVATGAVSAAKRALLDTLGCALFGAPEPWSQIMAAEVIAEGSKGRSTIVGHDEAVAAPAAALCNATAAHGFELDDHLDEAIVHLREALRINPNYADAWTNLGNAYFQTGRFGEAANAFQRALLIKPNLDPARRGFQAAKARALSS